LAAPLADGAELPLTELPIRTDLSLQQLEDFIVQLYPQITQLSLSEFSFVKSTISRQVVPVNGSTVSVASGAEEA